MGAVNADVGLSIVKELARDTAGIFTLASHAGFHQHNHLEGHEEPTELVLSIPFPGTLCALQVSKSELISNQQLLMRAKQRLRGANECGGSRGKRCGRAMQESPAGTQYE
jgi:hypothetical protein